MTPEPKRPSAIVGLSLLLYAQALVCAIIMWFIFTDQVEGEITAREYMLYGVYPFFAVTVANGLMKKKALARNVFFGVAWGIIPIELFLTEDRAQFILQSSLGLIPLGLITWYFFKSAKVVRYFSAAPNTHPEAD